MLPLPRQLLVLIAINKSEYAFEYLTAVVIGAYLLISSNGFLASGHQQDSSTDLPSGRKYFSEAAVAE
jgi:hypothetical protein